MKLSPHFDLKEFVESPTATKHGINNTPQRIHIYNLTKLCIHVLEPIREHFGKPVTIKSGYRCPALNKAIDGAPTSQHLSGEAADIEIAGVDNADIWLFIDSELDFDQVIAEYLKQDDGSAGWIHISYNHYGNRSEALSRTPKGYVSGLEFV